MRKLISVLLAAYAAVCLGELVPERVLFQASSMKTKPTGVPVSLTDAPCGRSGKVLKAEYPKYTGKNGEWPAVYFSKDKLSGGDITGWDSLVVTVYNPYEELVDLGICVRGGSKERYNLHVMLQPNAWNHRLYSIESIGKKIGKEITQIDLFMTRPAKDYTLYIDKIRLSKKSLPDDVLIPVNYPLASFEEAVLSTSFEINGVKVEMSDKWSVDGRKSALLTYPKHQKGNPPWPSFQWWCNGDRSIGNDWSYFGAIEFTTYNAGSLMTPLRVQFADNKGLTCTQDCLLSPGQENTWVFQLKDLGIDVSDMRQMDFFMSRPDTEYQLFIDSVKLKSPGLEEFNSQKQKLQSLHDEFSQLNHPKKAMALAEITDCSKDLEKAGEILGKEKATIGQLKRLTNAGARMNSWLTNNSRAMTEIKMISLTKENYPDSPFGIALADSMTKVMIVERPLNDIWFSKEAEIELARNENESIQVVLIGDVKSAEASIEVGDLANAEGTLFPPGAVSVSLVGHVKTLRPPYAASYQGWWPDPLLDFQKSAKVNPGEAVSFWVRAKAPMDTKPGVYKGKLTVKSEGKAVALLDMKIRVFSFSVPEKSVIDTAIDFRNHIRQVWGKDISQERHDELFQQCVDVLADYKIDLDSIYRRAPGSSPEKLMLHLPQLKKLKERGVLRKFNILYVGTDGRCTDVNDPKVQAAIDNALSVLRYWVPILKKEGLLEYAYVYGYDEVPKACFPVMAKVLKAIKAEFPEIPITTTAYDHTFGTASVLGDAVDIFTPLTSRYDPELASLARKQGRKVGWYICIGPHNPYANWFVEYQAIEARLLMGMMTAKYRPDWFLYYAVNRWPVNKGPITSGPYTNWNPASFNAANGDGSIFCAGPKGMIPTIRAENFRDGIEDYAYFLELERLLSEKKDLPSELVKSARQALVVGDSLVHTMSEYSHDPKVLRRKRQELAEHIEKIMAQ